MLLLAISMEGYRHAREVREGEQDVEDFDSSILATTGRGAIRRGALKLCLACRPAFEAPEPFSASKQNLSPNLARPKNSVSLTYRPVEDVAAAE